uniref:Rieske domain-containing protein n=1 Tax=Vitrella brassicaformis TaxID=1169539 RepID=A0A7S1P5R9_9ALVE|mmetsp:Transcript_34107/g.84375  ORF Transcript_34107/g.84375 Transcript_34107/m.84375 type:complete len:647 (+) Transcript_34107:1-1941(+)
MRSASSGRRSVAAPLIRWWTSSQAAIIQQPTLHLVARSQPPSTHPGPSHGHTEAPRSGPSNAPIAAALMAAAGFAWWSGDEGRRRGAAQCAARRGEEDVDIGADNEYEDGELYEVKVKSDKKVLVTRIKGQLFAVGALCSHYNAPLKKGVLGVDHITCAWHDAEFDLKTGKCVNGPGLKAIPTYPIRVNRGRVLVTLPSDMQDHVEPTLAKRDPKDKRVYAIVGAGAAGMAAAETLRQEGFTGRILMFGREAPPPYDRAVLSKNLHADVKKIVLRDHDFMKSAHIEYLNNSIVTHVDAKAKRIQLDDGDTYSYDKVLIATGAEPRKLFVPGHDCQNVFGLRRPEDARQIANFAKRGMRVVIVGSSFIGMEIAATLARKGCSVSVVGMETVPFERVLGLKVGAMFKKLLEEQGVEFWGNAIVKRFRGRHKAEWTRGEDMKGTPVEGVELTNGEVLACDAVVVGAGVIPNATLVEGVSMAKDGSILVDALLQSRDEPSLFAAGDVATFPYYKTGLDTRIEHWDVALQQGRTAAKNMMDKHQPFSTVPFFWTMIFGKSIRYAGHVKEFDELVVEGDLSKYQFVAYYIKDDKIEAVATCGRDPAAVGIAEAMRLNIMPTGSEVALGFCNAEMILARLKEYHKKPVKTRKR